MGQTLLVEPVDDCRVTRALPYIRPAALTLDDPKVG
jgi:hypothetical protein